METNLDLFIDNIKLNQVTVCMYLGVNIVYSLNLDKHVENVCKSAEKNLYLLKRIGHCISQKRHYSFISQLSRVNQIIGMLFGIIREKQN